MKFFYNLMVTTLLAFGPQLAAAQTESVIGAGSNSGTTTNGATADAGPMYNTGGISSFFYSKHHYVYTAAELSAAGVVPGQLIQKLSWRKANNAAIISTAAILFDIHLKNSTATSVPAAPQDYTTLTTGATLVYSSTNQNFTADTGWVEFALTTPFVYTGGALEITTAWDLSGAGTGTSTANFAWYKDPGVNILSWVGSTQSNSLSNLRTVRAQLRITHIPNAPCVDPPTPGAAAVSASSVCAGQVFGLSLQGTSFGAGQTYQWESSLDSLTWAPIPGATNASYSLSQPTSVAYYRCQVTCGNTTLPSGGVRVDAIVNGLSGTYSVNPLFPASATNFQSLNDALQIINCAGITGPVTLTMAPGNYTGNFTIGSFNGSSFGLNITSQNFNAADVVFDNGGSGNTFNIDGAENVTISSVTINNSQVPTVASAGININASTGITVTSCVIRGAVGSTTSLNRTIYALNSSNLLIIGNEISDSYYGIYHVGGTPPAFSTGNQYISNVFKRMYFYGIYITNHQLPVIEANYMDDFASNVSAYGMYVLRSRGITVGNNQMYGNLGAYGMFFSNVTLDTTNFVPNLVYNNVISCDFSGVSARAIYISGSTTDGRDELELAYNSIEMRMNNTSTTNDGAIYILGGSATIPAFSSLRIFNNSVKIIRDGGTTSNMGIYYLSGDFQKDSLLLNHNNYFQSGSNPGPIGRVLSTSYASMSDWRTYTAQEVASNEADPLYTSITDLRPLSVSPLKDAATPLSYVVSDITGITRSAQPDIGAYEIQLVANDLLAIDILTPIPQATAGSVVPVSFRFMNVGTDTLTFATMGYQMGASAPITEPFTGSLAPQDTATFTFLTQVTIPTSGSPILRVWTSLPNGFNDANSGNDTLDQLICLTIASGTYTVGGSGADFPDVSTLAQLLTCGGVSGPVTFNFTAPNGVFNEQMILGSIPGASATNTVTINGMGDTLRSAGAPGSPAVIILDGTKFLTIRNLVAEATGTTSAVLLRAAEDIHITQSTFFTDINQTSSLMAAIAGTDNFANVTTGSLNKNILIDSNVIVGGYYGIRFNGLVGAPTEQIIVRDNEIKDFYLYGVYFIQARACDVSGNDITRGGRVTVSTFYGVYFGTGSFGNLINANRIHDTNGSATSTTSAAYPLYAVGTAGTATDPNIFSNNLVYDINTLTGAIYGIYNSGGSHNYFYHNTIVLDNQLSTAGTTWAAYFLGTGSGNELKNNIIYVSRGGTGTKYCIYLGGTANQPASNNNVLNMLSTGGTTNNIGFFSAAQPTLADWQLVNSGVFDQNSTTADPIFVNASAFDFEPTSFAVNDIGANLLSLVPKDIFDSTRTSTPDPGAIEFSIAGCLGVLSTSTDSLSHDAARIMWLSAAAEWQLEYGSAGFSQGTGTFVTTTNRPYLITGLSPNTAYDVYIRDTCGTTVSPWSAVHSFTTLRDYDLEVIAVLSPENNVCADTVVPVQVIVGNKGTLSVSGYSISVDATGATTATINASSTNVIPSGGVDTLAVGVLNLSAGGTLDLTAIVSGNLDVYPGNDTMRVGLAVVPVPTPIVLSSADTVCAGDTVTLFIDPSQGIPNIIWFDDNSTLIGSGDTIRVPVSGASATFYAQGEGGLTQRIGPADTTIGPAASFAAASLSVQSLLVTAIEPVKFTGAKVYIEQTGWLVVMLRTTTGVDVASDSVWVVQNGPAYAPVYVNIDLDIPVGDWRLGALANQSAGGMLRNSAGQTPPYTIPGIFSITGNTFGAGYHYYYYDLEFSTGGCETPLVGRTIVVEPAPTADFTIDATARPTIQVDGGLSTNANSYRWDFGDGTTAVGQTATHTYTTNGSFTVKLVVSGDCRDDSTTTAVEIQGVGLEDFGAVEGLSVYPNPNAGSFNLRYTDEHRLPAYVRVRDMRGRLVYEELVSPNEAEVLLSIDMTSVAAGLYQLSINNERGVSHQKVNIMR